jgi:hypothetical protein
VSDWAGVVSMWQAELGYFDFGGCNTVPITNTPPKLESPDHGFGVTPSLSSKHSQCIPYDLG